MKKVVFFVVAFFVTQAHAAYTAQQICNKIPKLYRGKQINVFFDAVDPSASPNAYKKYQLMSLEREQSGGIVLMSKLGSFFRGPQVGDAYLMDVYEFPFNYATINGIRTITQIFGFPAEIPENLHQSSWAIYKLCQNQEGCTNPQRQKGEWAKIHDPIDQIPVSMAEVYAFYYPDTRTPPILNCLANPIPRPIGPFHRE